MTLPRGEIGAFGSSLARTGRIKAPPIPAEMICENRRREQRAAKRRNEPRLGRSLTQADLLIVGKVGRDLLCHFTGRGPLSPALESRDESDTPLRCNILSVVVSHRG